MNITSLHRPEISYSNSPVDSRLILPKTELYAPEKKP